MLCSCNVVLLMMFLCHKVVSVLCVALCPGIGWVVGCGGLLESDSGAGPVSGVTTASVQHGVPTTTTTTSLHCVTPHHNPRYSVPSVAPAQPLVSIFCRSSVPVSRIMIPPDLSPKVFSSCHNPPANQSFPAGPLMIHSTSETTSIILLHI